MAVDLMPDLREQHIHCCLVVKGKPFPFLFCRQILLAVLYGRSWFQLLKNSYLLCFFEMYDLWPVLHACFRISFIFRCTHTFCRQGKLVCEHVPALFSLVCVRRLWVSPMSFRCDHNSQCSSVPHQYVVEIWTWIRTSWLKFNPDKIYMMMWM